ncbi:hypothetical protein P3L10_024672 [Capsicum annuum]|uniref:uncharacterized protein LOC124886484 n=1 Tax=Capsicum annuum TaxID=4072 RepID=UPI001FB10CFF|nr:uncharacterized protein LOC124886484 [Capsicum annuum]
MKPARDDQKLEVEVEVSGQRGSSACLEEEMNNISSIGSAGSASDNCTQMEEISGVSGWDKMSDRNMRLHEMHNEIYALKGSMEGVANSVSKMGDIVDTKVVNATEIKQLIVAVVAGHGQQQNVPCDGQRNSHREAPIEVDEQNSGAAKAGTTREGEYQLPTRSYHVEFPKFDGTGLKDWIYKAEHFFDVR